MNEEIDMSGAIEMPEDIEAVGEVLKSWNIVGGLKHDKDGNLVLDGKLGEAVAAGSLREFLQALRDGKTPDMADPLTYQDIADFDAFSQRYLLAGAIDGTALLVRADGATLARDLDEPYEEYVTFKPARVTVEILEEEE